MCTSLGQINWSLINVNIKFFNEIKNLKLNSYGLFESLGIDNFEEYSTLNLSHHSINQYGHYFFSNKL